MKDNKKHEEESDKFWKDLIYTKGKIDEKKVLNELSDFYYIMQQVPQVYVAITGGLLSKLMYPAETVIGEFEEHNLDKGITQDDIKEMIESCDTLAELKEELKDYFNI